VGGICPPICCFVSLAQVVPVLAGSNMHFLKVFSVIVTALVFTSTALLTSDDTLVRRQQPPKCSYWTDNAVRVAPIWRGLMTNISVAITMSCVFGEKTLIWT